MPRAQSIARLAVTLTLLLLLSGTGIPAQAQNEEENRLRMYAGELFEILAVHKLDAPEFTWVLAKDRQFVEAGRERVFRYRFIDPGMYLLDATVADEDGAVQLRTSIQLEVTAREGAEPLPSGEQQTLLASEPAALNERVTLLPGRNIIRLLPKREGTQMFAIDTNANHDGNGDGNPANDDDNIDSTAHEDATPLFLWLTEPGESLHMISALLLEDGKLRRQDLTVVWEEQEPPQLIGSSDIIVEKRGEGAFAFSLPTDDEGAPLLYTWDFGDDMQSMLDEPVHEYTGNGAYQVRAVVKDLQTGTDIREASVEVIVDDARPPEAPAGDQSSSVGVVTPPPPPVEPEEPSEPSALRGYLLILIPLGIGLLAVLGLVIWLLRRFTGGGGLQQRLEEAEAKIMEQKGEEGKRAVIDVPPPLQIKRESPPDEPAAPTPAEPEPEPEQPSPPSFPAPPAEPAVDLAAAPPWLQQGLAQEEKPTPPPESAAPVQTEPVPSAPAEAPAEPSVPSVTPASTEPASEPAPLPPWLQPPEETVETQPPMEAVPPEPPAPAPTEEKAPPESPPPAPAQTAAAPAPAATLPTEERADDDKAEAAAVNDEAAERERERKRQKRQRYRENVRKRKQAQTSADNSEQKQEEPSVTDVPPSTEPTPPEKSEAPSAPSEALPQWLQTEPEQSPAAPSVEQPESTPPPATDQKPSVSEPSTIEPSSATPAPVEAPTPIPPVVQDIPPAEPSIAASTTSPKEPADGDVAFLIKADSVSEDNGKKPDDPKKGA